MPPRDRPSRQRSWLLIFLLSSLLAHLLFFLAIVVISFFLPKPQLKATPTDTTVSLSIEPPPPPVAATPPKPQHIFMPTQADPDAKHKETLIESDNDTRLKSQSQTARLPDSIMPDVTAKPKHASDMSNAPNAPSKNPPAAAPPGAQSQQQKTAKQSPSPTQQQPPNPSTAQQAAPQPNSAAKQPQPDPSKTPTKVQQPQLDANGLPILPPINAPTIAPRSQQQESMPASSVPQVAQNVHGAVGTHGDNSPEAMATELGRYKAKVYRAVGNRWYQKVDQQLQVLPVGVVHIQFTIHRDGSVETKVLSGDEGSMQLLLAVSLNSIREAAPFDPFSDAMVKQIGDSYTDDFSFSIYGGGD
jgi:hypothetical protein